MARLTMIELECDVVNQLAERKKKFPGVSLRQLGNVAIRKGMAAMDAWLKDTYDQPPSVCKVDGCGKYAGK